MRRSISGGQKKRLTTGEMLVGPTKVLFMDEISTGLDSSTTFQIIRCIQQIVHLGEATVLVSLLQPAPEVFELFDDVMLLSEGQIVYQGPREYVLEFFERCRFRCPERKGVADFLQEVTSKKDQEQYWIQNEKPYRYVSVSDFVAKFKKFHMGKSLKKQLSVPFNKRRIHKSALVFSKQSVSTLELLKASCSKEWLLMKRNSFVYVFKTVQQPVPPTSDQGDNHEEVHDFDPIEVFTVEDFLEEDEILEEYRNKIGEELMASVDGEASSVPRRRRQSGPRRYVPRNREAGHDDLVANYFSANPIYTDEMFRRRFRMNKPLFLRIVETLGQWSPYFTQRVDAIGRHGHSPLQKCTAAIRMLGYGTSADQLDEVLKIAASTSLECLGKFAKGVIECFGGEYLRPPRSDELEKILQENESRGFPGMMGSIDCMLWAWKNCPKGWAGMFTRGDKGIPTMILEAVASRDLRIWHAFFGTAGSHNDINVLNRSPLFIDTLKGEAPGVQYYVNGTQYDTGYYLADRIYPEWAAFMKTIPAPQTEKDKLFAQKQEGARKDVECAFGVLQSRFDIVRRPARLWKQEDVINIMQACVILHNMIVEDEKELVKIPLDLNDNPSATIVLPPEVSTSNNPNLCFAEVLRRNSAIRARPTHRQLKKDLVEHIWQRYGHTDN